MYWPEPLAKELSTVPVLKKSRKRKERKRTRAEETLAEKRKRTSEWNGEGNEDGGEEGVMEEKTERKWKNMAICREGPQSNTTRIGARVSFTGQSLLLITVPVLRQTQSNCPWC